MTSIPQHCTLALVSAFIVVVAANANAQEPEASAGSSTGVRNDEHDTSPPAEANAAILVATKKLFGLLNESERRKLVYDFKDQAQRQRWSNFPTAVFSRGGLRMGDLTAQQRDAVHDVLKAALSARGYEKVSQIVEGDEVLKKTDKGFGGPPGGGPPGGHDRHNAPPPTGGPPAPPGAGGPRRPDGNSHPSALFGRDNYYISILGQPSATEPWMIQFGGHHLGLNITLAGERGTLAPSHTGAQPAHYELEGQMVRPLGREAEKAFALLSSLDEKQRKQAILGSETHDLVLGPGRDGQMIQPEGIKGSELSGKQREMLLDLASEWTGIQTPAVAATTMEEMRKNIAETWFTWSGPTEKGKAAYFRIQGPTVLIEYAPQGLGGDPTNHIHTIYRDPTNDYGGKWWK